jgi:5'-methylthioadenosine phosphorylase
MTARDSLAVIGGSGAHKLLVAQAQHINRLGPTPTPFGLSAPLYRARMGGARFLFLPRHGETGYDIAAPWVNYRANIYALKEHGVSRIMAWSGPGAIDVSLRVGDYLIPTDLIDHTQGRESSFYKGTGLGFIRQHPVFCPELREAAGRALHGLRLPYRDFGTYICTQGPRLETRAEIRLFRSWGAHLVGMTLVPEAFLARELEICYLPICYISNYAEGVQERPSRPGELFEGLLEQAEQQAVEAAVARFLEIAAALCHTMPQDRNCPCARAMERYRRAGRIEEDWHTWIGKP